MKEKKQLIENIEKAIEKESIAPEDKKLLTEVKLELERAKKTQHLDIAAKIAGILGVGVKIIKAFMSSG